MASAFKICGQKRFNDGFGEFNAGHARAEAENVGIVMPAGKLCVKFCCAEGCAYALVMVGCHGHANACSAEQDARSGFFLNSLGDIVGYVGIIAAFRRVGAMICDSQAALLELTDNDIFKIQSRVITADMNILSHVVLRFVRKRVRKS